MAAFDKAFSFDLQPFDRGIDIAHGAACAALLAQHVPGLQRLPQLQRDAAVMDAAEGWKAEFELREIPFRREIVARAPKFLQHIEKIFPEEMRQHEAVVQHGAPAHELALLRLAPELG